MKDDALPLNRTMILASVQHHDTICESFEDAWQDGKHPKIEDWLEKVPEDERPVLFSLLAKREQELRAGEQVIDEFRKRFPTYAEIIDSFLCSEGSTDFDVRFDQERAQPFPNIPGYRILDRIAFGGMGVIYKAVQIGLDRTVALKMVRGGAWIKDDELSRFRIEAKAVAGLHHPNVVHVHDYGTFEGLPFFTMEYVEGGSLAQKLVAEPMNFRDAAILVEILSRTMQLVHDRQLVHRDLKPGNILLTKDGSPKISDFGLAKRLNTDLSMTVSGTVMGTASYMAPEQARGDRQITHAVDVYSLGAILYECLTGRPPFRDDSYEKTIRLVCDAEVLRPREILALIPPELEAVCLKCLEKDPAARYAKSVELADDLRRYLSGEPLSIGTFDVIDQHERWARKIGLDDLDLMGCTQWAFVYRAREKMINRNVVLKISTGHVGSPSHARLIRQAEAMAGLSHRGLEQLYTYAEMGGQPYLVQEYVKGRSLSSLMRERAVDPDDIPVLPDSNPSAEISANRLPPRGLFTPIVIELAADWIRMLARILQFVHENQVLHCAIYPGEIRLMSDGTPKLCGFGAAQKLRSGRMPIDASASWVRPNYQSPEQIRGDWDSLGPAADIYSLGAVLYELLTGQAPFYGVSIQETRDAVMKELPVAPRNLNPRVPAQLDWLCQRCLAKKPADRFASAADLAEALEQAIRTRGNSTLETANIESGINFLLPSTEFELRILLAGQTKPAVFSLPRKWVSIGRAPESDVVIPDDYCSRHHCAIYWDERAKQHVLVLIKAKHGAKVNGQTVHGSQALTPGDLIQVASAKLLFERRSAN